MARNRKRLSYKKELYYIFCIVAFVVILLFSFFAPGGYRDLQKARLELQVKRDSIEAIKQENQQRMQSIEDLQTDPDAWERYAREKGWAKEGEIIQRLSK